jgi:uncharacterized membrane protein
MTDLLPKLRVASWVVLGLAAIALALLLGKTGAMAGWCIFPGILIACASVAASPGRPLMLYAAFGDLMGFAFWLGVSAINAGQYLDLLPALLLLVGVSWFLREPEWPSFIFTGVVVALCLGLMAYLYSHRFDLSHSDLELTVRVVNTSVVMLVVGAVFLAVGFIEVKLKKAVKRKKKSRAIRTPSPPPIL